MSFDRTKPYIFFSYAHKEPEVGLQIIRQLEARNFNLWYDEGIEVGTEYSDYIAQHIEGCTVFVCLMDENYIESRYCRDEIDFAVNQNGIQILIIYKKEIKDLQIPPGLKMRTSRYQAVFLNRFPNLDKFMESLCAADVLSSCNERFAKAKEKPVFSVFEESGFNPTFQQKKRAEQIVDTFALFGVKIDGFTGVAEGPRITRYEFRPAGGQKLHKILELADDISLALGVGHLRMICPIPGKMAFGVEVPNDIPKNVDFDEVFSSDAFRNSEDKLCVVLGKDSENAPRVIELSKAPHLLIGGQAWTGKSTLLHNMILSLIKNTAPEEVKLLLIDPIKSEFSVYGKSNHLFLPVVTDEQKGLESLQDLVTEMLRRLAHFAKNGARDITSYNRISEDPMSRIVVFIDEMSRIIEKSPRDFETAVSRLAQGGRAAGIHLVMATGDLSSSTVTGILKACIPARIALSVMTAIESRVIIDTRGAEKLMMKGDMLYQPIGASKPTRIQGAYVDLDKIADMIAFDCTQGNTPAKKEAELEQALALAKQYGAISPSLLEQRMQVSYQKALRIIKKLDEMGHLAPAEGRGKPRKLKNI